MTGKVLERFLAKVTRTPGCWVWTGATTTAGYGLLKVQYRKRAAHRLAYEHYIGPIPEGLQVDHLCRVRSCVNPDHLEAVTARENQHRGEQVGRTHCPSGHLKSEYMRRDRTGHAYCPPCRRDRRLTRKGAT